MPEDAQPNDLRGRQGHTGAPSVRPTRPIPRSRDYLPSGARALFKRPSDPSYPASPSPAKRRRIDKPPRKESRKEPRKEIVRELPPACRKGAPDSHRQRQQFISREIEYLQETKPGLKVSSYTVGVSTVSFLCLEVDILNCSLAPSAASGSQMQRNGRSQTKVEPPTQYLPAPDPIISTIAGPTRSFKSGILSFEPPLLGSTDVIRERAVIPRPPRAPEANLDDLTPVAELLFGKQGPSKSTKASSSTAVTAISGAKSAAPSSSGAQRVKLLPQSQLQATASTELPLLPRAQSKDKSSIQALSNTSTEPSSTGAISAPPHPSLGFGVLLPGGDHGYEPDGDEFRIPIRLQHDKLRRFLCGTTPAASIVISMYGNIEGVDIASRNHWPIDQGPNPMKGAVEDACLVIDGDRSLTVLGHGRDTHQLSLINNKTTDDAVSAIDLERPKITGKNITGKSAGVSAVASMMQPLTFISGGYDHSIHLWTVKDDLSSATPAALNIKHNSLVQSLLAIRDTSHKLVSAGADCSVHIWDLSSERVVNTLKPSNSVYHVHPTTSPFCTLLEVAHRELQFEVRDHRVIEKNPVQRFGYTCVQVHGRFMKGAALENCFASGDRDGHVRLWDLRNTKTPRAEIECFDGQKIAHLVFQSSRLLACSEYNQIRSIKYDRPL
ncbi:WD40-repeat-containing domain protein [Mycena maculata]|uniref:WD40-repeat-containing domain protein n=1 Tax=Mycena maculata TaxID=230809 RepID=A0AAD7IG94_9AGAR|nr:WD40-repeat-containing domain protein [Mycena maculata]